MPYNALAVRVFIASPSDVRVERDGVEQALSRWNGSHGERRGVSLVPLRYEEHAVPQFGTEAQKVITNQLLENADVVIAIFGAKVGSPTVDSRSGTTEEIMEAHGRGVPVHAYFSTAPVPRDLIAEAADLDEYKSAFEGLWRPFDTVDALQRYVLDAVEHDLDGILAGLEVPGTEGKNDAAVSDIRLSAEHESYVDFGSKGVPKNRTRHWIEIQNPSVIDAEDLTIEFSDLDGVFMIDDVMEPETLYAHDTRRIRYELSLGADRKAAVVVRWRENGQERELKRDLRLY